MCDVGYCGGEACYYVLVPVHQILYYYCTVVVRRTIVLSSPSVSFVASGRRVRRPLSHIYFSVFPVPLCFSPYTRKQTSTAMDPPRSASVKAAAPLPSRARRPSSSVAAKDSALDDSLEEIRTLCRSRDGKALAEVRCYLLDERCRGDKPYLALFAEQRYWLADAGLLAGALRAHERCAVERVLWRTQQTRKNSTVQKRKLERLAVCYYVVV